jgi:uncharacterized protein
MNAGTIEAVIRWQDQLGGDDPLEITFHGGEPLVPGFDFYRMALPALKTGLGARLRGFAMQSNLWGLTPELCDLFRQHNLSLGTSLDGPEAINDGQRGAGYYQRTMQGIRLAQAHGLNVGCICTFTPQSLPHVDEIVDFFINEGLSFSVHPALPSIRPPSPDEWVLSGEQFGDLLVGLLARYLQDCTKIQISTLDSLCHSVSANRGGICTFGDCLGSYLAVDPHGNIFPCQRFAGLPQFQIGNVHQAPTMEELTATPTWQMLKDRQERIRVDCGDCVYFDFCRGGCPYNTLAANHERFNGILRDPHCAAYQRIFHHILDKGIEAVFAPENMDKVINQPARQSGLLRSGRMAALINGDSHPYHCAQNARRILASVALASTGSPSTSLEAFSQLGLVDNPERSRLGMEKLHQQLTSPAQGLNNLYLHVTFACPLHCTHCYAQAGNAGNGALSVVEIIRICQDASQLGFRHAVITGGEPLVHPQRAALLDALHAIRQQIKPLLTVLRTSLALPIGDDLLQCLAESTDEVVVSVDGDETTHDARRGSGSYARTLENLRRLAAHGLKTDLSLACVLPAELANGAPGESVRQLARELGLQRTRFRPVLPLGRAPEGEPGLQPEALSGNTPPDDLLRYGFHPVHTCGLGQNLYVEPDGAAYPCYAWHPPSALLGHVNRNGGLTEMVNSPGFQQLRHHTVNDNHRCQGCSLRYLCGGACRAWNQLPQGAQTDLDMAPLNCAPLFQRARAMLLAALEYLEISPEGWKRVGLPLPDQPSQCVGSFGVNHL